MSLAEYWVPDGPEQGLHLPADLSYEKWTALGAVLSKMEKGIMWALGDWWNYGEHRYGDRAFQAAATGYAVATLRRASRVARQFPQGQRDPEISFSHHAEVAALPPETIEKLLTEAKEEELSSTELRVRVRATRSRAALETELRRTDDARARASGEPERYPVLIADPPWGEMGLEDLCDYEAPAGTQAVCFLWAPMRHLPDGLSVLAAWGFPYRGHLVWPALGLGEDEEMGNPWVDVGHQLVLIGARGDVLPAFRPPSLLEYGAANRSRQSKLLDLVKGMYPDLPVLEAWAAVAAR